MSEIKIAQIQTFLNNFGLDQSDFDKLSKDEIEDFTPFVDKAKSGIRDVLMADTEFIDGLTRPFKDAPIGKEKQLKKEARKYFNLQIKEDDLGKISLTEILAQGTESLKTADNAEIDKYKNAYTELLEENEKLKNEVMPNAVAEVENKWKSISSEKDIREELSGIIASETQVKKENLSVFVTAYKGYLAQLGLNLEIDNKRNLTIKDKDGLPPKTETGILRLKESVKEFEAKMQGNIKPAGTPSAGSAGSTTSKSRGLLEIMGKGFVKA